MGSVVVVEEGSVGSHKGGFREVTKVEDWIVGWMLKREESGVEKVTTEASGH